jgi:hypothetical protein
VTGYTANLDSTVVRAAFFAILGVKAYEFVISPFRISKVIASK